jgi:imidazole glycerol phosphate synthase subunit HisF
MNLPPQQQRICDLLLEGCSNQEISKKLRISVQTVKHHFHSLFLRFGITGGIKRIKLAVMLYEKGKHEETISSNAVINPMLRPESSSELGSYGGCLWP